MEQRRKKPLRKLLAVIVEREEKSYPPEKRLSREELACVEP